MRFIYKMLLGLILFNAMLVIFAYFFPMSPATGHDISGDTTYSNYGNIGSGLFNNMYTNAVATGGIVFGGSILVGIFTGSLNLWIGIGAIVSVFVALWNMSWGTIQNLTSSYPVVNDLIVVMSIVIGILAVISIAEVLTAQRGAD